VKLATLRTDGNGTTAAVAVTATGYVHLPYPDVNALLADQDWRTTAGAAVARADETSGTIEPSMEQFAPLLPSARKVICCGLNYGDHIHEMGRDLPEYPTLFAKFADTLTGAADTIDVYGSSKVDWEAELAVVVGSRLYQADETQAQAAIAGYTVANDLSMRDWQNRTLQWFQGKAWDATTPVGPVLLTADEAGNSFDVKGFVNGELVQSGNTATLVFSPAALLSYISHFTALQPGDLVLTGTPGGVGMGMTPPRFLKDGDVLTTEISGIGTLTNIVRIHQSDGGAGVRMPVAASTKE
jgi:acylpyruvate hydrolase